MPLFQNAVVNKYLDKQDKANLLVKWNDFKNHFHNPVIQSNIRNSKEEEYQGEFLIDLFVNILGYTKKPSESFNLTTEHKNIKDSKKADGAIIIDEVVKAVIELKGTKTTDLNKIEVQAFGYKNNQPECVYVITSNFEKVRFYIDNATEHLDFNLFHLTQKEFELLYLCLAYENLSKGIPKTIKDESVTEEKNITKFLYSDYSLFKRELHQNLVELNPEFDALELFQKSQKLLDRFLFIFFAEDRNLLPTNLIFRINKEWRQLQEMRLNISLYDRYKTYFNDLNQGAKVVLPAFSETKSTQKEEHQIFAYNGGLFQPDSVLDVIKIDDELLFTHTQKLSKYDFQSEVDVNILGHIFENSLNELDEVKAQLEGVVIDKSSTKRKKDGVFYTPKYITKYIVDNTIGKLCTEQKANLKINEEDYFTDKKRTNKTKQPLLEKLSTYRNWLLQLTICDPACGSGAFLNQALDFLIAEHRYIDELQAKLFGDALVLSDIEKSILENNLFGVDLNEESVEIAKLSLWLRTAQPNRKLNDLSGNIKCGNSLIDDESIAGTSAFNWQTEFPKIFDKGGFDVIIGNPPYGDYFNLVEKTHLLKKFQNSFSGTFDMYIMFFDVALKLLKPHGKLCYITPNTFVDFAQFSSLRNLLLKDNNIEEVIGLTNVFEDAIVDTAIIILTKDKAQEATFKGINIKEKIASLESSRIPLLSSDNLTINGFIIKSTGNFSVKKICESSPYKLSDVLKITQGITTGGNDIFINSKEFFIERKIPGEVIKKVLKGKSINRNKILYDGDYILYSTKKTDVETQTKIENLLQEYKSKLSEKRETAQGSLPWYCLHWSRDEKDFNEPKILIRQTASHIIGVFDSQNYYSLDTLHTLNLKVKVVNSECTLKSLLAILNSKLFRYLYKWKLDEDGKVYPQVKKVNIEWLPIPELINTDLLSVKMDELLEINSKEEKGRVKFLNFLKSKFNNSILNSKKIENWSGLSFADFITELNKILKSSGGIPLTKKDEFDWIELFDENMTNSQNLKLEIEEKEREIDKMVYELYGLTPEEIEILEKS